MVLVSFHSIPGTRGSQQLRVCCQTRGTVEAPGSTTFSNDQRAGEQENKTGHSVLLLDKERLLDPTHPGKCAHRKEAPQPGGHRTLG